MACSLWDFLGIEACPWQQLCRNGSQGDSRMGHASWRAHSGACAHFAAAQVLGSLRAHVYTSQSAARSWLGSKPRSQSKSSMARLDSPTCLAHKTSEC